MGEGPVEAAARQAAEILLQDEGIASDLEDPQAEALLRWALDEAKRVVANRWQRGQGLDREAVAAAIQPVRQAARVIGDLVASHACLGQDEVLRQLLALTAVVSRLGTAVSGDLDGCTPASGGPDIPPGLSQEPDASALATDEPSPPPPAAEGPDASTEAAGEPPTPPRPRKEPTRSRRRLMNSRQPRRRSRQRQGGGSDALQ